jgi:Flp pilus assembly protein TadD
VSFRSIARAVAVPRVAWRLDAYWILALLTACALALSGCGTVGADAKNDLQAQAEQSAKQRSTEIEKALENAKPPMQRGDEAMARGDYEAAARFYRFAHDQNPDAVAPLLKTGEAAIKAGSYTLAYQAFHLAQVRDSTNADAAFRLGELMLMRGSPQAALDQFAIAQKSRPDDPSLLSAIGVAYSAMGKYDLAIKSYQAGLKIVPDHMGLRNNLGMAQFLSGDFDGAVVTLSALLAKPNSQPRYRRNLAFVYAVHGDMDKARQVAVSDADRAALASDLATYKQDAANPGQGADRALMGIHFAAEAAKPAYASATGMVSMPPRSGVPAQ